MKVAVLLFENFETLDVFGPVEILGRLPDFFQVGYYSQDGGVQCSTQGVKILTEKMDQLVSQIDILLIPGGLGTRKEINNIKLISAIQQLAYLSTYVLTVCTGSALLAQSTLLDGMSATSNKRAFDWVKSVRPEVKWKEKARWTVDGKYYTSSGISAGMDMTLGFISDILDEAIADRVAFEMEYEWNNNPDHDVFSRKKPSV